MKILRLIPKFELLVAIILMSIYSFDGVVLSQIIAVAGTFTKTTTGSEVLKFGLISVGSWTAVYLANYFLSVILADIVRRVEIVLKNNFVISEFNKENYYVDPSHITSAINNDFKLIETNYLKAMFSVISNSMMFLVSLIYILFLNPVISSIFIAFSFLPMIVPKLFSKILSKSAKDWSSMNGILVKRINELFQGRFVVKLYSVVSPMRRILKNSILNAENSNFIVSKRQAQAGAVGAILAGISFIFPFVLGIYLIISGNDLSIAVLVAIFLANDRVIGPLQSITEAINQINTTKGLRSKYFQFSEYSEENEALTEKEITKQSISELSIVNLRYKLRNNTLLNFNAKFDGNFKVLIYGDSGTGKTTLLNLISGVIKPLSGEIKAYSNGNVAKLSDSIAYITQKPFIFDTNIKNNVTLFDNERFSDQEVERVLEKVGLVNELGEQTLYVETGNDGENMSAGQRQRIEIARALLRSKTLYLVDEATANLDDKNAEIIRKILFELDVPVIEVAHHFDINDIRYTRILNISEIMTKEDSEVTDNN